MGTEVDHLQAENARLRADLKWIAEQRWNENADLDEICARAERSLSSTNGEP